MYGSLGRSLRKFLWADLNHQLVLQGCPWLTIGDVNSITSLEEVSNNNKLEQGRSASFSRWIFENKLVDIGFVSLKLVGLFLMWKA